MEKIEEVKGKLTDEELQTFHIKCITISIQLRKKFGRNWFTLRDLMNQLPKINAETEAERQIQHDTNEEEMIKRVEALKMVGLIKERVIGKKLKFRTNLSAMNKYLEQTKREKRG